MQDDNTKTKEVEEVAADETQPTEIVVDENTQVQLATPSQDKVEEVEEETSEASQEEAPEQEEAQEESTEEAPEEQPPSRRETLRIQQLLKKYGPPPERQVAPLQKQEALDYNNELDADPEVIQRLEEDRKAATQSAYLSGNEQAMRNLQFMEFKNNIRFDLPVVAEKLSKLEPEVAQAIDQKYIQLTGANPAAGTVDNPNVSYADFVEAEIEFGERLAKSMTATTVKNVAKQAAATGLRPDGSSAKRLNLNQAPENMTIEELYAKIGQKPPKKS